MQYSIYHMTLKSHLFANFEPKNHDFDIRKRDVFMDVNTCCNVICIFNPLMDYRFKCMALLHSQTQHHMINRGSYMSAHVLLNLSNEFGKKIRCEALLRI